MKLELTKEERQLKEAMKILIRDGKGGRLFDAAKQRYLALKTETRLQNITAEYLQGVEGATHNPFENDIKVIDKMIS
ncbi:MAG: hypothetical protein PHH57_08055 [Candidatus Omnitrophica bacterium]|nr:hypothetical protein [Candidatus Omnitrophota bacterium]